MKKVVVSLLVMCMALQTVVFGAYASAEGDIEKKITILQDMGIITYDDEMEYSEDEVTREMLASILYYFYNGARNTEVNEYTGEWPFTDLDQGYWASGDIMTLVERGCMGGFTDNTFRLEETATQLQAIKSLIVVLGYTDVAEMKGGWPNGYIAVSNELGLTKGMQIAYNSPMTKGDFVHLLYNALHAEVMEMEFKGIQNVTYQPGDTLMNSLGFYEIKGIMTATDVTALLGYKEASENRAVINGIEFDVNFNCNNYLGMNVEAIYKKVNGMDIGEIVYIEEFNNDIVVIDDDDIVMDQTTSSVFCYLNENDRLKAVSIDPEVTLIFNGKRLTYFSEGHLEPKDGTVTLIDADKNGEYETITVKSYTSYFVSNIVANENEVIITDKLGKTPVRIDLADHKYTIIKNAAVTNTEALKKDTVISIAADQMTADTLAVMGTSTCFELVVSDTTEDGIIQGYSQEENKITINGTVYPISKWFNDTLYSIRLNKDTKVYLSASKEVVAATYSEVESYGFLLGIYPADDSEEDVYFKIFTETAETIKAKAVPKFKIDNKTFDTYEEAKKHIENANLKFVENVNTTFLNSNGKEQLIRFTMKGEEIATIDTVLQNYTDPVREKECFRFGKNLLGSEMGDDGKIIIMGKTMNGRYGFNAGVKIFTIPQDLSKNKAFGVSSSFTGSGNPSFSKMTVFDLDEFNVADAILMIGEKVESIDGKEVGSTGATLSLVDTIYQSIDEEDQPRTVIQGVKISDGSRMEMPLAADCNNVGLLQKGALIRYVDGGNGEATLLDITYIHDSDAGSLNSTYYRTPFSREKTYAVGKVLNISDEFLKLKAPDTAGTELVFASTSLKTVLIYNKDRNQMRKGTLADIRTAKDFGTSGASDVFLYCSYHAPTTMLIFE